MTPGEMLGYVGMFAGGAVPWLEAVVVIPVGIVAGLSPAVATVLAVAGNLVTVVLAGLWGERLNRWWARRRHARAAAAGTDAPDDVAGDEPVGSRRRGRAARLLRRYGLPGLAMVAPVVTGTQFAALAAVTAGAPRRAAVWWVSVATVAWSLVAAVATVTGLDLFVR